MSEYLHEDDAPRKIDLALWRRITRHARPYRRYVLAMIVSGIALAGTDALMPLLTGLLIDGAIEHGWGPHLLPATIGYTLVIAGFALGVWLFIWIAGRIATGVACDMRREGFRRLQQLSFSYYDVRPVGWLVTRLTSDVSKVSSLIPWFALDMAWGSSIIAAMIGLMLYLNWKLALVVLCIVPPLTLASVWFQRRLLESSRQMRKTNSIITASFNEGIMGVRTTKTLVREQDALDEFSVLSTDMHDWSVRNALQSAVYLPLVMMLGSVGVGLALWRGGVDVRAATGMTLGELVAFMQYATIFSMPIQELAARFTQLQAAQAAAERIQTLLDERPDVRDSPEAESAIELQRIEPKPGRAIDGGPTEIETVEFRNVSFWYKKGETVLDNFNLRIEGGAKGQTIALVGETGSGKSTIVNLAARFYEPTDGEILINGQEYRERSLAWLQSNLGIVMQTPHLFSGTIRDNIRYGRLDATDDEIETAARLVNAHDFIMRMEGGYDGEVGEGGSRLSTGQRQLISLARAVLADPQIFIMDEATSSVDTETERLIQDAIETALKGRIAFVIAHRLSTISSADVILVIDKGRILEQGTHDQLMAAGGRYRDLYTHHFIDEGAANVLARNDNTTGNPG